jgi:hypothetical protein
MLGGEIEDYTLLSSTSVFVATNGGIFKTADEGQTWTNITQNFDPNTVSCDQILKIGTALYAKTNSSTSQNVYKSTDEGGTWTPLTFSSWTPLSIGKLPGTLFAAGADYSSGEGRLYSSTDGNSWTPKAVLWTNWEVWECKLFFFQGYSRLYIVLNEKLFYTSDGNTLLPVSTTGLGSGGFFDGDNEVDGDAAGNLFFLGDNLLFKYDFTLDTWSDISSGKIPGNYSLMSFSVTDNVIFVCAMSETLGMKFYRSTDQGTIFTELTATGLSLPMIGNIIQVSANGFIGNWLDDQILVSSDGGTTWSSNATQYNATYAGNLTRSGNSLLFSREINGLILSANEGMNWSAGNNGIPGFGGIAYFVNEITQVKDTLFSFVQSDPFSNAIHLYKSTDYGTSWTSKPIPAPYDKGEEYSFAGICGSRLFVNYLDTVSFQYVLINSSNNGSSWAKPAIQNTNWRIYLKGPETCLFAFFGNDNWDDFDNVYRANSFGMSFSDLNTGIFNGSFLIKRVLSGNWDKGGPMMDFDAANNKAIFAVRDRMMGNGIDKLYLYNITSGMWSEINATGLPVDYLANCLKYIGNNIWLLATNTGLYKSTNGGVDWTITHNAGEWQRGIVVNSIQMIGDKAFLGTISNGVWIVDLSLSTGTTEQIKDDGLQIFPNPTSGSVRVILPEMNNKTVNISLYSLDGREIIKKAVNENPFQMDLNNVPSGSYFMVIKSNNHIYRKGIIRK